MCQNRSAMAVKRIEMSLFLREAVKGFTEVINKDLKDWECDKERRVCLWREQYTQRHERMTKHGIKFSVARSENPRGRDKAAKGGWRKIEIPLHHSKEL